MWNNTYLTSDLKQQKSRLQDDLAAGGAAAAELLALHPVGKWETPPDGHPQPQPEQAFQRRHPQYMSPGSHVASGGKAMISAISSSTQATNGVAAR